MQILYLTYLSSLQQVCFHIAIQHGVTATIVELIMLNLDVILHKVGFHGRKYNII